MADDDRTAAESKDSNQEEVELARKGVLVCGPCDTGKSCLVQRMWQGESYTHSNIYMSTMGVDFGSKITEATLNGESKPVKFQIWDTAGHQRFEQITRAYFRGASAALLCYDASKGSPDAVLESALSTLKKYHELAKASDFSGTMFVVPTKSDLGVDDDLRAAVSELCGKLGAKHCAATSVKAENGASIDVLLQDLAVHLMFPNADTTSDQK